MLKKSMVLLLAVGLLILPLKTYAAEDVETNSERPVMESTEAALAIDETELTAKPTAFGQIKLSWPKDKKSTGYIVYRYDKITTSYKAIKSIPSVNVTEYIDTKTKANETYKYQLTPVFDQMEGRNSKIVTATARVGAPKLKLKTKGTVATLDWKNIKNAEGYVIYRAANKNRGYKKIATISSSSESKYTDSSLANKSKYYYKIQAFSGSSKTEFSNIKRTPTILTDSWSSGKIAWPIPSMHNISSEFGNRVAPTAGATSTHDGIDISAPTGSSVVAAKSGTVTVVTSSSGRGIYVDIQHSNGLTTRYQHLSSAKVKVGDYVEIGDTVALSGNTGVSTGPHLHFEVLKNGTPVNPLKYIHRY